MNDRERYDWHPGMPLAVGFTALALLIGGIGVWSVRTEIAGAVIANGIIEVESNRQVVQHPEGGVVGDILARDGEHVTAGDVLIRLDDTLLSSERAIIESQLIEVRARRARLEAERDGTPDILFPDDLLELADDGGAVADQINGQRTLFEARVETEAREASQIAEQIRQSQNRISGIEAQLDALRAQEALISDELSDQENLLERGLVAVQRVTALRREAARLSGEIGRLTAEVAEVRGQIAALEIEVLKLKSHRRENAIVTLRDLQFREIELAERLLGLDERLARLDVRAPVSGIVHGSTVSTLQSVVPAADTLMYVVPQDQPLVVSARIAAIHVDQVHSGQSATLRFTAFDQRRTPEIAGRVVDVSADVFEDEVTGQTFYRVELMPLEEEMGKLDDQLLLPGMPVEAYLRTEKRTPLSYLTKPMTDYFKRAMREG